ncbi:SDR family oxidoreductase, partial [Tianweitania sp.]|uniref:SDR family oxidoreductase n=1 Tax=Tianweitania sp. TaxID=2021634 RepID=UPI0028A27666
AGGAQVALLDRDAAALDALPKQAGLHSIAVDLTQAAQVRAAVDREASLMGGLDGVVNSAGLDLRSPIETMSD